LAAILLIADPSHSESLSPRRLVEVVDLASPTISPDGRNVAFRLEQASIVRNGTDTAWYVQAMDGNSPPRRVGEGGVALRDSAGISLPASVSWSPDGRWIYYRALIDGKIDIWRAAADGSEAGPLTHDPADVRAFLLSADGKTLYYCLGATREEVITAEQAEYDRGVRIDETVPLGQPLFRSGAIEGRLATQRYGPVWFDRVTLLANTPDQWRTINLATGRNSGASEPPTAQPASSVPIPDALMTSIEPSTGRIAALIAVGGAESAAVELVMLTNQDAYLRNRCRAPLCLGKAITGLQWRPDSDDILFTATDPSQGLAQSLYIWNVRSGNVRLVLRSNGLVNGGRVVSSGCGVSSHFAACVSAQADRPPRLERVDLEAGNRRILFDPNEALARDLVQAAPSRLLRWTDKQGREFTGQFFAAHGEVRGAAPPLFVTYYSCTGFLRGGVGDEWPLASLAEHGISALCTNRPTARVADRVEAYNQALEGIQSVVDLLSSRREIDRTRVGMGGLSFGSAVTLWVATQSNLLVAASVSSPVVSPNYYLLGSLKGDRFTNGFREIWELGAPEETPDRWRLLSPVFSLDRIRAPILMQMPEQEYVQALDYAIPLIREDRADLYVFPNEPHQKFQPRHKLSAYERNLDWFRFWLQDYENPDPHKAEQYVRWREMRTARSAAARE